MAMRKLRRRTCVGLVIALGQICATGQNLSRQPENRDVAAGVEAMSAGRLAEARMDFEKALIEAPEEAQAQFEMGLLLGQAGDVPAAGEAFRRAIRARPGWPEAHYNLGLAMIADSVGKRDSAGAIAEFREAIRLRPGYPEARRMLGVCLAQLGEREAAVTELQAALAADPNSIETRIELGRVFEGLDDAVAAEREYRAAVKLRPGDAEAEIALGKLLLKRDGEQMEAVEHLRQALRANPDLPAAQYSLAKALQQSGRTAEAAIALREAAALTKRQQDAVQCTRLSNQGLDAARRGQTQTAVEDLRQAVALRPDSALAHYNLGLLLADGGDLAGGRAQLVEAISLLPADSRFYVALGRMCKRAGDLRCSTSAVARAAALDPANGAAMTELRDIPKTVQIPVKDDPMMYGAAADTPDAHFAFATVLAQRGDWVGATGEWLRVLAQRPNDVAARNNLGISYARIGQDENAELEFRKALEVSADSAGAHFGLGILNLQHGNKRQAAEELRQVVRLQPDYPEAQSLLKMAAQ